MQTRLCLPQRPLPLCFKFSLIKEEISYMIQLKDGNNVKKQKTKSKCELISHE
jgi:hypothetical protein